jgi:hypothetical protein
VQTRVGVLNVCRGGVFVATLRNLVAEILKDLLYPFKSVRHVLPQALVDPDNRVRFELMGLERVRIALVRGFDIPRGSMRERRFGLG